MLQNNIYARIDAMFAGAGAYATFTLGGLLAVEGFGGHTFTAGGVGGNTITVRNTTAGTGNYAALLLGNDSSALAFGLFGYSSTYTTSGPSIADSLQVYSGQAGGLSIAAQHASGVIRFYTGGTTERARFTTAGTLLLGETAETDLIDHGICINQGADTGGPSLTLKASFIGRTTGQYEADTYGAIGLRGVNGGITMYAAMEAGATVAPALELYAKAEAAYGDTTKSTTSNGIVVIRGEEGSAAGLDANENLLAVINYNTTRFILDSDGDSHQDVGTAWTNFDDYEDHELLSALSAGVSRKGDPLRRAFGGLLKKHRATLERNGIVTFNADGHHFVNWSRLNMLKVGAIRQNAKRIAEQAREIAALKRRLKALEA